MPRGIAINGLVSGGPLSINSTDEERSSDNRLARTHPAEPAPTMMKSYFCCKFYGPAEKL